MTDKEIIKAWEEEIHLAEYVDNDYCSGVEVSLIKSTLDLINRQQADIERFKEIANPKCQQCVEQTRKNSFVEFAERLKQRVITVPLCQYEEHGYKAVHYEIDDIVKELTEGSNGVN